MEDRTVRIHCHLDKEDPDLFPGMYVKASIETGSHEVSVLPDEAIVNFEGTSYVFTTGDGLSFRMEEIKTGSNQEGFTEVLPSAEQNERQIVTRGAFVLLSRLKNVEEE
jgi:cobalt-zinc-cadmium efflux system membrane fusion protein